MMSAPTAEIIAAARAALNVDENHIPQSIAIIMDGNGRWAQARNLPRSAGHEQGAKAVRRIVEEASRLGLDALTLFSFSIENWRRPSDEINTLMHLYSEYLIHQRPLLIEHNIRMRHIGRRDGLPDSVLRELDKSVDVTVNHTGMYLCLALNYGSRTEITDAVGRIARRVADGEITPEQVDEELISASLDYAGVPDPDLLIRTSGEMRLSNFLLWQISYAEIFVTDVYWPDFDEAELHKAIRCYAGRHRRFGGLDKSDPRG